MKETQVFQLVSLPVTTQDGLLPMQIILCPPHCGCSLCTPFSFSFELNRLFSSNIDHLSLEYIQAGTIPWWFGQCGHAESKDHGFTHHMAILQAPQLGAGLLSSRSQQLHGAAQHSVPPSSGGFFSLPWVTWLSLENVVPYTWKLLPRRVHTWVKTSQLDCVTEDCMLQLIRATQIGRAHPSARSRFLGAHWCTTSPSFPRTLMRPWDSFSPAERSKVMCVAVSGQVVRSGCRQIMMSVNHFPGWMKRPYGPREEQNHKMEGIWTPEWLCGTERPLPSPIWNCVVSKKLSLIQCSAIEILGSFQ